MKGMIRRIKQVEGFGFIRADETGLDYFFHRSSLDANVTFEDLREGDRVEFSEGIMLMDPRTGQPKGPRAENVRADRVG